MKPWLTIMSVLTSVFCGFMLHIKLTEPSLTIDIPIIDIKPLLDPDCTEAERLAIGDAVAQAATSLGFFYVEGHGLHAEQVEKMYNASDTFFSLTQEQKDSLMVETKTGLTRGYVSMGGESGSDALEVKEAYSYGYHWDDDANVNDFNSLQGYNVYPDPSLVGKDWQKTINHFYVKMIEISHLVTEAIAISLNFPTLNDYCESGDTISIMRLFKYFPYQTAEQRGIEGSDRAKIGSSAHTDWGFLTLILMEDQPDGLEVYSPVTEHWHAIPSRPGTLVVNCGDFLSILTGGRYKSPLHRVTTGSSKPRTSFVLFFYPSFDSILDPQLLKTSSEQHENVPQTYSLLHDQNDQGSSAGVDDPSDCKSPLQQDSQTKILQFGQYIAEKWKQVSRDQP